MPSGSPDGVGEAVVVGSSDGGALSDAEALGDAVADGLCGVGTGAVGVGTGGIRQQSVGRVAGVTLPTVVRSRGAVAGRLAAAPPAGGRIRTVPGAVVAGAGPAGAATTPRPRPELDWSPSESCGARAASGYGSAPAGRSATSASIPVTTA